MAAPFRDDPEAATTITPRSGSPRSRATEIPWGLSEAGAAAWPRRRVTHLASGTGSPHLPEIVDRFALSASGNRCAL